MMASRARRSLTFAEIDAMSEAELRKQYTIHRDIFQKRIGRLANFAPQVARPYQQGQMYAVPTLKQIGNLPYVKAGGQAVREADIRHRLKDLVNKLDTDINQTKLSITGIKAARKRAATKISQALSNAGYERIAPSNLRGFGRFMEEMRRRYGLKNVVSEEQAEFFDSLKSRVKRWGTKRIADLWEEYQNNGYQPDDTNQDLFAT